MSLSEATRKALGKPVKAKLLPPECRKSLRQGRCGTFEASLRGRRREAVQARLLPPECRKSLRQGRCGTFEARLVPLFFCTFLSNLKHALDVMLLPDYVPGLCKFIYHNSIDHWNSMR